MRGTAHIQMSYVLTWKCLEDFDHNLAKGIVVDRMGVEREERNLAEGRRRGGRVDGDPKVRGTRTNPCAAFEVQKCWGGRTYSTDVLAYGNQETPYVFTDKNM